MLKCLGCSAILLFLSTAGITADVVRVENWRPQSGEGCHAEISPDKSLFLEDNSTLTDAVLYSESIENDSAPGYNITFSYRVEADNKKSPAGGVFVRFYDASGKRIEQTAPYSLYDADSYRQGALICKRPAAAVKFNIMVKTYQSATGKMWLKDFKCQQLDDEQEIQRLIKNNHTASRRMFPEPHADEVMLMTDALPLTEFRVSPSVTERQYWDNISKKIPEAASLINKAEKILQEPFPELNDALYLEYWEKGVRSYRNAFHARTEILQTLVLAECFEGKGRFVEKIEDCLSSIMDERTWVLPAHDKTKANFKGINITVDLGAAARASLLTATRTVLHPVLTAQTNDRIVSEVYRRVLIPYAERIKSGNTADGFFWITASFNWNAFCSSNIAYCALSLPDIKKLKDYILAATLNSSEYFLAGFPDDGYCSEGIGYWCYGFGNYLLMAEALFRHSGGKINLFGREDVKVIADFGINIELHDNIYPAFADCPLYTKVKPFVSTVISSRMRPVKLPSKNLFRGTLPQILSFLELLSEMENGAPLAADLPAHSRFLTSDVLVVRDAPLKTSLAVKAGHNNEYHNHNDVGSYVLLVNDMLANCDPGLEVYTDRTFSKRRYESNLINSWGHAVPLVAGKMQSTGADFRGKILSHTSIDGTDTIVLDLKPAYDVDTLESLQRIIVFNRKEKTVSVNDNVTFTTPQQFGTAMITYELFDIVGKNNIKMSKNATKVNIAVSATGGNVRIGSELIQEKPAYINKQPYRIGVDFTEPVKTAGVTVTYHL